MPVYERVLGENTTVNLPVAASADLELRDWHRHPKFDGGVWVHHDFPGYQVHEQDGRAAVLRRLRGRPGLAGAISVVRHAFGDGVCLQSHVVSLLALRIPLLVAPAIRLTFADRKRCRPIDDTATKLIIRGVEVELRLTETVMKPGAPMVFAEALIGGSHTRLDGEPRSFLYTADLRRLPPRNEQQLMLLASLVIDGLFVFASGFEEKGFTIDCAARSTSRKIARRGTCGGSTTWRSMSACRSRRTGASSPGAGPPRSSASPTGASWRIAFRISGRASFDRRQGSFLRRWAAPAPRRAAPGRVAA